MSELTDEIKRLKNLKQNKNKAEHLLEKDAQKNIWKKQVDIELRFDKPEDKKLAIKLFEDYLDNYLFESFSDINALADLVFEEVLKFNLQSKLQKKIGDKDDAFVPEKLVDAIHNVDEKVFQLKERLGINKQLEKQNDLSALQQLEKRFNTYIQFNKHEFSTVCSSCGHPQLLRRRVKDFDNLKHPFFSGRFWYNRRGIELVKSGIWTKEQYAFVFFTSVDYVDWCIKNEKDIVQIDEVENSAIQEFINSCPHLKQPKIPENILEDK
jgi:hypothetical protein